MAEPRGDRLSHLDESGAAHMVDVTGKNATKRTAVAAGMLRTRADVVELIATGGLPKGDALATARVAGILAAKRTSELIPLCHQLALTGVDVDFEVGEAEVAITATVRSTDRTGVEMEALTAVSVAALTLYDMIKAVDPAARIDDIRVLRKEGGKTGFGRDDERLREDQTVMTRSGRVVIASTRAATGVYEDRCGPIIVDWLIQRGIATPVPTVVADGTEVNHALFAAIGENVDVVITSGGTGISPTDRTADATANIVDYQIPGLADAIRRSGLPHVPTSVLSRGVCGVRDRTLIVNLPGSTGGVKDGLGVLDDVLEHALDQLAGKDHTR